MTDSVRRCQPFTEADAPPQKVRGAEDAWNTRDPERVRARLHRGHAGGATAPSFRSGASRSQASCSASGRANSTTG